MGSFASALSEGVSFPVLAPFRVIRAALTDWWYSWVSLAAINTLWLLACVTIVLAPPATFALYYVAYDLVAGKGIAVSDYVRGIRLYFVKSWLWGLVNIVAAVLFYANLRFYGSVDAGWALALLTVSLVLAAVWIMVQFYALAYWMFLETPTLRTALRNGLFTLLASPPYSLVLAVVLGVIIYLSINIVIVTFIGGPALIAVLGCHAVRERLRAFKIVPTPEPPSDDVAM
jgi:uncharacterized membrane protein YesL